MINPGREEPQEIWVLWSAAADSRCAGDLGDQSYRVGLAGLNDQGEGRSLDVALSNLADRVQDYVQLWDAEADEYRSSRASLDRINQYREPELVTWAREALRTGTLLERLDAAPKTTRDVD